MLFFYIYFLFLDFLFYFNFRETLAVSYMYLLAICMPSIFLFQLLWWIGIHVDTFSSWHWTIHYNAATKCYTNKFLYFFIINCFHCPRQSFENQRTIWKSRKCSIHHMQDTQIRFSMLEELKTFRILSFSYHLVMS